MLKHYFLSIRPNHLLISIAPIALYFSFIISTNSNINCMNFIITIISILLFHISVNTLADVRDFKKGIDTIESMGSSGMIVKGLVKTKVVRKIGIFSFILGSILGLIAVILANIKLLFIGIPAALICFSYSEGPLSLKYRALGEICVFLIWGPMLSMVCSLSLTYKILPEILMLSIIPGILTAMILLSNNIRDFKYDQSSGNNTLVTIIGIKYGFALLFFLIGIAFFLPIIFISCGMLPTHILTVFASYIFVFKAMKHLNEQIFTEFFVWLDLSYCSLISIQLCIERFF